MPHPGSLLDLLRGRALDVLGARLALGGESTERLAHDLATALVVVGAERLRDDREGVEALVEAADTDTLGAVPLALADPANDAEDAVGVLLGGERERVLGLVAQRSGAAAPAVATGAAAIAPIVAAWLKQDDRPAAAALAAAADGLSGSAGWLSAGAASTSFSAATTAAATATPAAALGARRVAAWGLVLAAALAAGIVGAALGFRGDGSGDDFPAAASSTVDAAGEDTTAPTETTETTDATETTATETVETTETTDTTATTETPDTTETTDAGGAAADVAAALVAAGPYTTLVDALAQSPGTLSAVAATDPVTVFAPDDAAFAALPASAIPDQAALDGVLGYHVVPGVLTPDRLKDGQVLTTLSGRRLTVERKGAVIRVGGTVARPLPRPASGDVVYALKKVLQPPATINAEIGLAPITFESGSDVITPAGRAVLEKAVAYLTATPLRVLIEGHTDADGDEASNLDLSNRRAAAVRRYLIAGGVRAGLLTTRGFGESTPVASNATDAGKARNRRIAFRVLGPA